MRYLFVHQNFPAQYVHLARHLAAQKQHDILFITESNRNQMAGVRKLVRRLPRPPGNVGHPYLLDLQLAMLRADNVANAAQSLKSLGFVPDIVIGHHGWGELLHVGDVWKNVKLLGYYEFFYNLDGFDVGFDPEFPPSPDIGARLRVKNAVNLMALGNPGHGQTPTKFQLSTYPETAREKISVLPEGVDLDVCRPNPALRRKAMSVAGYKIGASEKLVTYVVRDLEPYRGFHVMMRALPHLLLARSDLRVILVGGDGVSYGARLPKGTWRERMLNELGSQLDLSRVHFPGRVPYESYVKLLQRSDAHVYLTYPFVASWSLREAMATGCAIVASDTAPVREFIRHRKTGLLAPFLEPAQIAARVLDLLDDGALNARLRENARAWAEANLDMKHYLAAYERLIRKTIG